MRLTGIQFSQFQAAILAAFTRDELRRLLKIDLDADLESITSDKGFAAQVFDLLLWLERQERLLEFANSVQAANPANTTLALACADLRSRTGQAGHRIGGAAGDLAGILGIDWIEIPAGLLHMGSDPRRDIWAQPAETPQQDLMLPAYRIARCPITNYQYQVFVLATEHAPPPHWRDGAFPPGKHDHPVVNISWYDALAFCRWANVGLPSEALWERAARGSGSPLWPWGDEAPTPLRCNFALRIANTTPVALYPGGASTYGVLDMAGNVWEWTRSLWLPYPYAAEDGRESDQGSGLRVVRGGSYDSPARHLRCACRSAINPRYGYDDVGMRVVLYNPAATIPTGK